MSKNIKRDEKGHPILRGAMLYNYSARPKSKRTDTSDLKSQASNRLLLLLKKGALADRLACPCVKENVSKQEQDAIEFQREYAETPAVARFAHHNNILKDLRKELEELLMSGNKRKIKLTQSLLEKQISEQEEIMRELYVEIKNSRLVVRRD